jgi:hypothetical protein
MANDTFPNNSHLRPALTALKEEDVALSESNLLITLLGLFNPLMNG